jgi:aldehyde:ferredoxin oxidoreductase
MDHLLLKIDLSNRSYQLEEISKTIIKKYIGGRGLGSYFLYKLVPPKIDPLAENNYIIFTAGPASGTGFPFSPKGNINTKSPLTGLYLYSISSGILSQQMRKSGLWAIAIKGISDSPVYLVIENRKVEFKDASSLWGLEPAKAQKAMVKGFKSKNVSTLAIGPAGERMIPFAAIFCEGDLYRCFGRGGAGCVMGSKKLKGMIVSGDGDISIGDKEKFSSLKREVSRLLKNEWRKWAESWRRYETAADLEITNEMGILPTRNWQGGQFENWRNIDKSTTPLGWPEKGRACGPNCPAPGCREVQIKDGPYKGAKSDIEWETIYAFGSTCGVDRMDAIIAASQICDEFGIDTMTAGITIGFAMECFEKGLLTLKDTDGIELRFGNHEAMIAALKKLATQEGFGKQLAKGTKRLSEEIKGSEPFAMHAKGMELGGYECRGLNGQALQFAISTRGGCHHAYGLPARKEIFDGTRLQVLGKGEYVKQTAINRIVMDSLILCTFPPLFDQRLLAEILSALFGEPWSLEEVKTAGERIMAQERLFNMQEGITRKDDILPLRLLREPKPDGPTKGTTVPLEELKDDFYKAMGYELSTGNPPDSLLSLLGIDK